MADAPDATNAPLQELKAAQENPNLPRIYTNGFAVGLSNADVIMVLKLSGQPSHVVHMSYTLAKTLAQRLGLVVSQFEEAVKTELVTTDKIDLAFAKRDKESSDSRIQ